MGAQKLTIAIGPEVLQSLPAREHLQQPQTQKKPHRRRQLGEDSIAKLASRLPEEVRLLSISTNSACIVLILVLLTAFGIIVNFRAYTDPDTALRSYKLSHVSRVGGVEAGANCSCMSA